MCLLSFHDEGVTADYDTMSGGAVNNPDGFGFAVHTGDRILRGRGLEFDRVYSDYLTAMRSGGVSMFHHRWATHGAISKKNCHPFYVGGDSRTLLGHNGILPVSIPVGDQRSDTRLFADKVLPALGGLGALEGDTLSAELSKVVAGNRLVILTTDPTASADWFIIGEASGHWVGRSWFSNYSYVPYVVPKYQGLYTSTISGISSRAELSEDTRFYSDQCAACWTWLDFEPDELGVFAPCPVCASCVLCGEAFDLCRSECWADFQ